MNTIPAYSSTSHLYPSLLHPSGSLTTNSHVAVPWADLIHDSLIDPSLTAHARPHSIYHTQMAPIHHLQECLHAAALELARVTGQRATLRCAAKLQACFGKFLTHSNRAVLSELAEKLSIASREIVDFSPLELPSSTPQLQPTRESHPNI
jgi:hypothetical protein